MLMIYIALPRTCRTVRTIAQPEGGAEENRSRARAHGTPPKLARSSKSAHSLLGWVPILSA